MAPIVPPASPIAVATRPSIPGRCSIDADGATHWGEALASRGGGRGHGLRRSDTVIAPAARSRPVEQLLVEFASMADGPATSSS